MYLGLDGWIDDDIALVRPWGFDPAAITVPVSIWHGAADTRIPQAHTDWLLAHVPTATGHQHPGGHDLGDAATRQILHWLTVTSAEDLRRVAERSDPDQVLDRIDRRGGGRVGLAQAAEDLAEERAER
jgi:hypothetical protein